MSDRATFAAHTDSRAVIDVVDVRKMFGDVEALRGVTASIPAGVIGLLGPNGAGKTTLLRLLLGLETADSGRLDLLGWPLPTSALQARAEIGYMPEDDCLFPGLLGVEQVLRAGQLSGLSKTESLHRAHRCLDLVGIGEARHREAAGFSLGMRQRLRLAMSIVHGPRLVLLDEPTAGLDPEGREEMLDVIAEIGTSGTSVLLSTHVLSDVEAVCDQVVLLSQGRLAFCGPISRFKAAAGGARWRLDPVAPVEDVVSMLQAAGFKAEADGPLVVLELDKGQHSLLWAVARDKGFGVRGLWPVEESIGDAFIRHLHLDDPARPRRIDAQRRGPS